MFDVFLVSLQEEQQVLQRQLLTVKKELDSLKESMASSEKVDMPPGLGVLVLLNNNPPRMPCETPSQSTDSLQLFSESLMCIVDGCSSIITADVGHKK